jgi:ribosomal protein S19
VRPRFLSATALRLLFAALDPRRRLHIQLLFQRPAGEGARSHSWLPRPWLSRRARLVQRFRQQTLRIHRGRRWRRLLIQRWHIGFAIGSFARTQALAIFKKKASAKKRKKRVSFGSGPSMDFRVQRIKDTKAGLRRRSSVLVDTRVEAQLRGLA